MNKYDVRGYRLLRWRYIYLHMLVCLVVFTGFNIFVSGTVGLLFTPLFCLGFGWQLGCVSERNEWQAWYKKHRKDKPTSSRDKQLGDKK